MIVTSKLCNVCNMPNLQSVALSSANQHAMPPEFTGISGAEYLSTSRATCGIQRDSETVKERERDA